MAGTARPDFISGKLSMGKQINKPWFCETGIKYFIQMMAYKFNTCPRIANALLLWLV
jgi:hypothetical protein